MLDLEQFLEQRRTRTNEGPLPPLPVPIQLPPNLAVEDLLKAQEKKEPMHQISPFAPFPDLADLIFSESDPRLELKEHMQVDEYEVNDKKRYFEYKMVWRVASLLSHG